MVKRTCILIFSKIGLADQSKTMHTDVIAEKSLVEETCDVQLEFQKVTPFGHDT